MTNPAPAAQSFCTKSFGYEDFDPKLLGNQKDWKKCPIGGCHLDVITVGVKRRSRIPVCVEHGIRLHAGTFVYWNGMENEIEARLRNIVVRPDLARKFVAGKTGKVESGRLGYEMSEDALSWNVFVGLMEAGALAKAVSHLCGTKPSREPDLYLWGFGIVDRADAPKAFAPLDAVRGCLEQGIRKFVTEPDIMLVIPGELLVCIEAKFGSGNPLAHLGKSAALEKPTDVDGLLTRYLPADAKARSAINHAQVRDPLHSQLFRNVVFAAEMAALAGIEDWRVVNLVGETLWEEKKGTKQPAGYSLNDPTQEIEKYLRSEHRHRFSFRHWEGLHGSALKDIPAVARYMASKSAHFRPAFNLMLE
jgi:hypothetical protein